MTSRPGPTTTAPSTAPARRPVEGAGGAVVIAVTTYRRSELLPPMLAALVDQAATLVPAAVVLVVDNDPDAGARDVVSAWSDRGVRYVHEPRPGISAARNRALDEATGADALVFIDDDELPSPGWLRALTETWRRWGCAGVAGPVPPRFLGPVDPWVAGCGVFDRPVRATGELLAGAGAGNLLLDLAQVRALGLRFDELLGLVGGEDTLFTHQLVHRGGQLRWCAEAEAVESTPADRITRRWAIRRSFRSGSSFSRAELSLAGGPAGRLRFRAVVLAKAAGRATAALADLLLGLALRRVASRARAQVVLASYAGLVAGAFGGTVHEYARPATEEQHVVRH